NCFYFIGKREGTDRNWGYGATFPIACKSCDGISRTIGSRQVFFLKSIETFSEFKDIRYFSESWQRKTYNETNCFMGNSRRTGGRHTRFQQLRVFRHESRKS